MSPSPDPSPQPEQLSRHVPALDGIRGLAIFLVLMQHLLRANDRTGNPIFDLFSRAAHAAWVGVDLFFVLSGFLITGILFDSLGAARFFRSFYARRILRIFPLYYGFLLALLLLTHPLHLVWHGMQWMLLLYLQNTGLLFPAFAYAPSPYVPLSHFWSLAVEEQFYLVWPVLIFWIRDRRRLIAATLILSALALAFRFVVVAFGSTNEFIFTFTLCRADSLLLGGCLALLLRGRSRDRVLAASPLILLLSLAFLFTIAFHAHGFDWHSGYLLRTVGFSVIALACATLIAETFRPSSWTRRFFELPVLRWLGRYSYGICIFHYTVTATLTDPLRAMIFASSHSHLVSVAGAALLVLLLTLAIAWLSFNFYEKPFLTLKRRFSYRGPVPATASPLSTQA